MIDAPEAVQCQELVWSEKPRSSNGRFQAEGIVQCDLPVAVSTSEVKAALESEIQKKEAIVSGSPETGSLYRYQFVDEGDRVDVKERVLLGFVNGALHYRSETQEIQGTGKNAYLREIRFDLTLIEGPRSKVAFKTYIEIERPWYAPAFLFNPLAESKTKSKLALQAHAMATRIYEKREHLLYP